MDHKSKCILKTQPAPPVYEPSVGTFQGSVGPVPTGAPKFPYTTYSLARRAEEKRVTDASGGQKGVKLERFDLIPSWALREIARVYGMGEEKYPSDAAGPNWRRGYKWGLSFGAMLRHATLFWLGNALDKESGLHHLAHAAWHCFTLMTFWREKIGTDDRFDTKFPDETLPPPHE